jgi:hypothetical protein
MCKVLREHPFVDIIDKFLIQHGITLKPVKEANSIYWSFFCNPGLSVWFSLYVDEADEVFVHLDVSFGRIKSRDSGAALLFMQKNFDHHYPLWFAIDDSGCISLKFRCYSDGVSAEHLLIRLQTIMILGRRSATEFVISKNILFPLENESMANTTVH